MVRSPPTPAALASALDAALADVPATDLRVAVESLIARYQAGTSPLDPTAEEAAAYAVYRMPATCAVVQQVLHWYAELDPDFAPLSLCDVGGGTGAAMWAAAAAMPALATVDVVERSAQMRAVAAGLVKHAPYDAVRTARWQQNAYSIGESVTDSDLVIVSYVLGELAEQDRDEVCRAVAAKADVGVIIEPGTPSGYRRILAARQTLIDAGMRIAAPCPHPLPCPIAGSEDWCHFAVRVNRSALHRWTKSASLGHEDEKFSYVIGTRRDVTPAPARIVRHPGQRKGLVELTLCTEPPGLRSTSASRRDGARYREARKTHWGDAWRNAER